MELVCQRSETFSAEPKVSPQLFLPLGALSKSTPLQQVQSSPFENTFSPKAGKVSLYESHPETMFSQVSSSE